MMISNGSTYIPRTGFARLFIFEKGSSKAQSHELFSLSRFV